MVRFDVEKKITLFGPHRGKLVLLSIMNDYSFSLYHSGIIKLRYTKKLFLRVFYCGNDKSYSYRLIFSNFTGVHIIVPYLSAYGLYSL